MMFECFCRANKLKYNFISSSICVQQLKVDHHHRHLPIERIGIIAVRTVEQGQVVGGERGRSVGRDHQKGEQNTTTDANQNDQDALLPTHSAQRETPTGRPSRATSASVAHSDAANVHWKWKCKATCASLGPTTWTMAMGVVCNGTCTIDWCATTGLIPPPFFFFLFCQNLMFSIVCKQRGRMIDGLARAQKQKWIG